MASITKYNETKWRVYISRNGTRRSKIFDTKDEAMQWAQTFEDRGCLTNTTKCDMTISTLFQEYYHNVSYFKRGYKEELRRIIGLQKDESLSKLILREVSSQDIQLWINRRIGSISPQTKRPIKSSTVAREMTLIKAVFNKAVEWGYIAESPAQNVVYRVVEDHRERVATDQEIEILKQVALWDENEPPVYKYQRIVAAFVFACFTGMRIGEIVEMEKSWYKDNRIVIPREVTKTFHGRTIAVPNRAVNILNQVLSLNLEPKIFGIEPHKHDALFRKIRSLANLEPVYDSQGRMIKEGLNFHDSRATFCTWAASPGADGNPRLDVLALARQLGHRSLKYLMHYYRKDPTDLIDRLNS